MTLPGAEPPARDDLSQWFTDSTLAHRIVEWADPDVGPFLEPSAGSGALVEHLLRYATTAGGLTAVELDSKWAARLSQRFSDDVEVVCSDFLAWRPPTDALFELTIQNPPYEDDQDLLHVAKACEISKRVVALVRSNFLHGVERNKQIWGRYALRRLVILKRRPRFSGSANSPRHDFIVVEIEGHRAQGDTWLPATVEWW